jgi:hypothetical protein
VALLAGLLAFPFVASADPGHLTPRIDSPLMLHDDATINAEERSAQVPSGLTLAISSDRAHRYQLLGQLPSQSLRIGPLLVYNNTLVCDPNNLTLLDFNRTSGAGGIFEGFVDALCSNGSITGGCDPNACDPATLTGPAYYQDAGASIPAEVNGFSFMYMTDHSNAPGFVPPDLNQDGDVDGGDFALFGQCFAGSGNPPAGSCPSGVDADFDNDTDVDGADFALFGQCFGGAGNLPAGGCPFGQGGGGGNQIDMDFCFSVGTTVGGGGSVGTIIENDFSGSGGSSASKAIYRCVNLPPDNVPGDDNLSFIFVDVDLDTSPPRWVAERPIDSAVFSGAVLKEGVAPTNPNRHFILPGGNFGVNMGAPDGTIEDLNTIMAFGGQGATDVLRFLDASPVACAGNGNPCGTPTTPDLNFLFTGTNDLGASCFYDNCNTCPVDQSQLFLQLYTAELPGEPNETIDPALPTSLFGAGCFTVVAEIGGGLGPTDIDMYRVEVPAPPPAGWRLSAFGEAVGGSPETRGNPLIRIFTNAGAELANVDSDGRPENSDLGCQPHPGVNALAGVNITTSGTFWVAVSGGGCDAFLPSDHPTTPCEPDPAATCNNAYNPLTNAGTQAGDEGVYTITIALASLDSGGEPGGFNDSIPTATVIGALPYDSGAGALVLGDGPFGGCLGDHDYYLVADATSTNGQFLDSVTESNSTGANTDTFMIVYETNAGSPTAGKRIVAVHDAEAASFDSRTLVEILASKDYYVMVMGVGLDGGAGADTRGTCFRQFGGFTEYEPGYNQQLSGGGDAVPGAGGTVLAGTYRLLITSRVQGAGFGQVPPANTGPFEPNDSLAQAAANAVLTVQLDQTVPTTTTAFMGDGRYSWALGLLPSIIGDVDMYKITGLDPNDLLEAVASPDEVSTVQLFSYICQNDHSATVDANAGQILATPTIRLIFPNGGISSQNLFPVNDPNDTYVMVVSEDARTDFAFFGNLMPWDITTPGTLLMGQFTGSYQFSLKGRSTPPPVEAGSRMWGVFRGSLSTSMVEINANTGTIVSTFALPVAVNGASTGLAHAKTPPGHTGDVLYYLNTQGTLNGSLRMWHLDPNTGAFVTGGPPTGFTNLNTDAYILGPAGIPLNDMRGGTDGLGYAGTKLWMCNQNQDKIVRWNTASRLADGHLVFTAAPFLRECRDGLEGSDDSNLVPVR